LTLDPFPIRAGILAYDCIAVADVRLEIKFGCFPPEFLIFIIEECDLELAFLPT